MTNSEPSPGSELTQCCRHAHAPRLEQSPDQARPLAPGSEEGLENSRLRLRRDAAARIAHTDAQMPSGEGCAQSDLTNAFSTALAGLQRIFPADSAAHRRALYDCL